MKCIIISAAFIIPCLGFSQTWNSLGYGMVGGGPTGFSPLEKFYIGTSCTGTCTFTGMPVRGVCTLDGGQIDTLESGVDGYVNKAIWYNGRLIAGGMFSDAGPPPFGVPFTKDIASYDTVTQTWSSLTPTAGINAAVECMEVYNNELYIGGRMTTINGVTCNRIAKYNGSSWTNVAGGVSGSTEAIFCMAIYHGQLYIGGDFQLAGTGSMPVWYIARWDGTQWDSVGGGMNAPVQALIVDTVNDVLYVGGGFTRAGDATAYGVAVWNDSIWAPVGVGTDTLWGTRCLAMYNGNIVAGGANVTITSLGDTIRNVYTYDGTKWTSLDGGTSNSVLEMCVYNGNLYVGGGFSQVGYGIPANRIACYGTTCPTSVGISEQPPPVPFSMYPNPADDVLHITAQDPGELIFRMYNSSGQLVKEQKFRSQLDYSTAELAAGVYTVQVCLKDGTRSHSEELIVK